MKCLLSSFAHFLIEQNSVGSIGINVFIFLLSSYKSSSSSLDATPLSDMGFCKYFLLWLVFSFSLRCLSQSKCFKFSFMACACGIASKMSSPKPEVYILCYLLKVLSFAFYIQVYDPFYVNFCERCKVSVQNFSQGACECTVVPAPSVEKTTLSPSNCLCSFVKNQWTIFMWVYFYSIPLFYLPILPLILHSLDYCSFIRQLIFDNGSKIVQWGKGQSVSK